MFSQNPTFKDYVGAVVIGLIFSAPLILTIIRENV